MLSLKEAWVQVLVGEIRFCMLHGAAHPPKKTQTNKKTKSNQTMKDGRQKTVYHGILGFPGSSAVKNPPAMQETWVRSLGQEDPLEKEMATHSSSLIWEIPLTRSLVGYIHRVAKSRTRLSMHTRMHTHPQNRIL